MEPFEIWLYKADHDLLAAKKLFEEESVLFDIVVFHAQQCAEKSLKAFGAFKLQPVHKTHDLNVLVNECKEFDTDFEKIRARALYLNSYDTQFRYPGDELNPIFEEAEQAIEYAVYIFQFVNDKIALHR